MLNSPKSIYTAFHKIFHSEIDLILNNRIVRIFEFLNSVSNTNETFKVWVENASNLRSRHFLHQKQQFLDELVELNIKFYNQPAIDAFENLTDGFIQKREDLLHEVPHVKEEMQDDLCFDKQEEDSAWVSGVKRVKKSALSTHRFFLKKEPPIHWKRNVPLRNYARYYFTVFPVNDLWKLTEEVLELEITCLTEIKEEVVSMEQLFTVEKPFPAKKEMLEALQKVQETCIHFQQQFQDYQKTIESNVNQLLSKINAEFTKHYYKAGTFELRPFRVRTKLLNKKQRKGREMLKNNFLGWETTLFAQSEDWSFDLDLFTIRNATHLAIFELEKSQAIAYEKKVLKKLNDIKETINKIRDSIIHSRAGTEGMRSRLEGYRAEMEALLNENDLKIAAGDDSHQNLENAIIELQQKVEGAVENISNERMIVKSAIKYGEVEMSDLMSVHPRELIQFEMLPKLKGKFEEIEKKLHNSITNFEINLIDIAHFVDYNFDTANSIFEKEDTVLKDAKNISDDGLKLADEKLNKAITDLQLIYSNIIDGVKENLSVFEEEVVELTENEKVSALRIRLLKAMAFNKTEQFKEKTINWIKHIWDLILDKTKWLWTKGALVTEQLSSMYYQKGSDGQVNADISNFLAETRTAIERLPYIYQRLFKLEPVSKGYLFFKRQDELVTMRNAYHNWRLNRFASLALIGEKGAGVTSMTQHFLLDIPLEQFTVDFKSIKEAFREQVFMDAISTAMGFELGLTKEQLVEKLNTIEDKAAIVLEGLQYIYLRKVDGFDSLKLFFELTSNTNSNIFWISTCTIHAWNYLEKVLRIGEYMGYVVRLGEFSNDEMIEIVTKRHKVSGYDLQFLPSKDEITSRKYKKLTTEEQQDFLRKQFFQQLNQLAKGNISVALIFWLRSAHDIKNNVLSLKSMNDFDSSFIKDLEQDKLFGLHALLLHDGLTVLDFCKVMRYKPELGKIRLMQMLDDGLLLKFGDRYVINFLLYRTTINALSTKNLLH